MKQTLLLTKILDENVREIKQSTNHPALSKNERPKSVGFSSKKR